MKYFLIIVTTILLTNKLLANDEHDNHKGEDGHHGHHGHHAEERFGKSKAITEVTGEGFKLSRQAEETLKLKYEILGSRKIEIPIKSVVTSLAQNAVFIKRNGYIKKLNIKIIKREKLNVLIEIDGYEKGDLFISSNVGLVGVSDIFSKDESEYGHSH